jgi:hypothetical protein
LNRWLLNNLATWELGLLIVGGFVLIALVGLKLTWRWVPALRTGESNDVAGVILGVLAAVYGIVLAFVIVALYEEYRVAGNDVRTEATALSKVYRDSQAFAPPGAIAVKTSVGNYIATVVVDEWPKMKHGEESEKGWTDLAAIYAALRSYSPKTVVQKTFYTEAVARVNDLAGARRQRLNDAEEALPTTFNVLLVGGALLLLAVTFLFATGNPRLHAVLAVSVAILLGFNLLLALVLDYPFSGTIAVSSHPFTAGALADFAHLLVRH